MRPYLIVAHIVHCSDHYIQRLECVSVRVQGRLRVLVALVLKDDCTLLLVERQSQSFKVREHCSVEVIVCVNVAVFVNSVLAELVADGL